jgi:DNA repair exonuclease SbcCD ATPase subunit
MKMPAIKRDTQTALRDAQARIAELESTIAAAIEEHKTACANPDASIETIEALAQKREQLHRQHAELRARLDALAARQLHEAHLEEIRKFREAIAQVEKSFPHGVLAMVKNAAESLIMFAENLEAMAKAQQKWLETFPGNLPRPMSALFGMEDIVRRFAEAVLPFHHSMEQWNEPLDKKLKGLRAAAADFAPSQERLFREAIAEIKSHAPPDAEQTEKAA